jgi:hypothetical protein
LYPANDGNLSVRGTREDNGATEIQVPRPRLARILEKLPLAVVGDRGR